MTGSQALRIVDTARGSDHALVRRMLDGDSDAFAAIYRGEQTRVYRFALDMCGSTALAEDVVQETFLVLMRDGARYQPSRGPLSAFLLGIARNLVLRALRRNRGEVPLEDDFQQPQSRASVHEVEAALEVARDVAAVRRAVLALPSPYRESVVLCDLEEQPYAIAAEAMGVSIGTVRSRLHRARQLLYRKLSAGGSGKGVPLL
jgi:RNA polymerase sigma-70 factor, ECF subfamily